MDIMKTDKTCILFNKTTIIAKQKTINHKIMFSNKDFDVDK